MPSLWTKKFYHSQIHSDNGHLLKKIQIPWWQFENLKSATIFKMYNIITWIIIASVVDFLGVKLN